MACSIGGPDVKSDQCALNGSLLIRPAAMSSASAPDPAWSPMLSVTFDTFVVPAEVVALPAGSAEPADEHADAPRASSPAVAAAAPSRIRIRLGA
jgi:hypothetical protein